MVKTFDPRPKQTEPPALPVVPVLLPRLTRSSSYKPSRILSEGRFSITYCPGNLTRHEIESVNFKYHDLAEMTNKYDPKKLKDGFNMMVDGEEIYYISNPALGLWTSKARLTD